MNDLFAGRRSTFLSAGITTSLGDLQALNSVSKASIDAILVAHCNSEIDLREGVPKFGVFIVETLDPFFCPNRDKGGEDAEDGLEHYSPFLAMPRETE